MNTIRVLLIEDDPDYSQLMNIYVNNACGESLTYALEPAVSLRDGLDLLARKEYDIVLLDLMLPDSQGLDTLTRLRACAPGVPFVVLTNLANEETGIAAIAAGAQDYLIKSKVDPQQLRRSLGYALERSRLYQQMENLARSFPDGIVIIDHANMVRYANPAALALLRRAPEQVQGRLFEYPLGAGGPSELKLPGSHGDITVEVRLIDVEWRGMTARLATLRDITELKHLEKMRAEFKERERVDKLKDALLSTVSHELRTPLSTIKMAVGTIRDQLAGPLTKEQDQLIRTADRNISRLSRIIGNFLDLSRLESRAARADIEDVELGVLLREVTDDFRLSPRSRNIVIILDLARGLPAVRADRDMIAQVLINLLDNALRYARGRITVRAKLVGQEVLVSVVDDGPGIPDDKTVDIFNKFTQLDRPKGGEGYKGTGLGLAICREIISINAGRIWAENVKDWGAGFYFTLPVAPAPAPAPAAAGGHYGKASQ